MKQQDTKIVLWGLFFSLLAVALYAVVALCKRRKPDLSTAINILISAGGIIVGIRLIGFAVTGQLKRLTKAWTRHAVPSYTSGSGPQPR